MNVGVNIGLADSHNEYDTVEERYQKVRHEVQKFTTFQFGICAFYWCKKTKKYLARPFCFYIFPRSKMYNSAFVF